MANFYKCAFTMKKIASVKYAIVLRASWATRPVVFSVALGPGREGKTRPKMF
jgi:hypothetical protein